MTADEHRRELVLQEAGPDSIFPVTIETVDLLEDFDEQFFCMRTQIIYLFAQFRNELLPRAFNLNRFLDERANSLNFFALNYLAGKTERSFSGVDSTIRYLR